MDNFKGENHCPNFKLGYRQFITCRGIERRKVGVTPHVSRYVTAKT